jgi:hypothetical protein
MNDLYCFRRQHALIFLASSQNYHVVSTFHHKQQTIFSPQPLNKSNAIIDVLCSAERAMPYDIEYAFIQREYVQNYARLKNCSFVVLYPSLKALFFWN